MSIQIEGTFRRGQRRSMYSEVFSEIRIKNEHSFLIPFALNIQKYF